MSTLDEEHQKKAGLPETEDLLRDQILENAKYFKTSWTNLGQALYPVWRDKMFRKWGYEKFETYSEKELGIAKTTAIKLLKTYSFLEENEPDYLKKEFAQTREAARVPGCDEVNVLRLARQKRELNREDYGKLKRSIFDKGKSASVIRRELTSLMKERKKMDPEKERQMRLQTSVRKMINAIRSFQKDMSALKLISSELIDEAKNLQDHLQKEIEE